MPAPVPPPMEWTSWKPQGKVAGLGLLAHDVEHRVDELGAFRVVALGPVVARARLAEDEVVRAEELAEGARADGVHGAGLEVHEDGARHVAAARRLVVVDVDALELEVRVAVVRARRVDAVLVGDDLPELGADLVAALAALDVDDLAHGCLGEVTCGGAARSKVRMTAEVRRRLLRPAAAAAARRRGLFGVALAPARMYQQGLLPRAQKRRALVEMGSGHHGRRCDRRRHG